MKPETADYLAKARTTLADAQQIAALPLPHVAAREAYYAAFHAAGIYGCYFHVSEAHLHRYTAEFDFRYNNRIALGVDDVERTDRVIRGVVGKRLTYETTRSSRAGEPPF
jgi:hypothetical protein